MRHLLQNCILVLFSIILLSVCAAKINASKIIPAGATEVTRYKTVAFLDFSGNKGRDISSRLETVVIKAEVNDKKQYSVVDRANIDKIIKEQQFQMTMANPDTIVDFGQLVGAEAVWAGHAQSTYNVSRSYETRSKCMNYVDGKCQYFREYIVPCETRDMLINVTPKLTSISTGQVVYAKEFKGKDSTYGCSDNLFTTQSEGELYESALRNILYNFRLDIAPYLQTIQIKLMSNTDGTNDTSKLLLKNGISFAKNDRMEKACELWQNGLKESPYSISLNYNVGVCRELAGKFNDALSYFSKAEDYAGKPVRVISDAINRAKESIENQKTLKQQM